MFRQKINFILHVFLEIWEWYFKLVILSTFDMPDYAHPKWYYQLVGNFVRYFTWKLEFVSNILWIIVATHTQSDTMNLWKMFVFICWQKSTSSPNFSGDISKICKLLILGTGHGNPKWNQFVENFDACLHTKNKFFLRYYNLKNPTIWLASSILSNSSRTRILPNMGLVMKYR